MDPQVTLYEALEAIEEEDSLEAARLLYILANWVESGGFLPKIELTPQGYYAVGRNH